ncbi:glycoside hydrolase family 3 protein [Maribacter algarum]|uniref:beta-N-acetylhexosaminidase n=1 Tax=Maribacter algarum (ex Zhang et al. 2020) TaxID=2578118 RepID=A0A5S3PHW3_9FLAO|nr:glycoside hydrolase family 3 protein [Maribacter algarum]TMM53837.1 glycoside hydrolase family 3 protein [Maribacter algarum]
MKKIPNYEVAKSEFSLSEKVGQLFMPAAFINDTEEEIQKLEKLIQENAIGSLCFFHSRASAATNYEGKKEVVYNAESFETLKALIKRYQSVSKYPLLIAIDAEWGLAMRIENTPQYPYNITLGAIQKNVGLVFDVGRNIAKDCKAAGIHWNLAPCIDINNNPDNPVIGYRSFGEDKINVTEKALAFIKGTQSEGILTSIKHFPGHGDTATDSHLGLPLIEKSKDELVANELYPFQKLIGEGIDSVMVGHLSVPTLANGQKISTSISKDIIKGLLRNEMGFNGVVISDALNMHAVSKNYPNKGELEWLAFEAGNDVLCFAEHIPQGIETILKNAFEERIEESFQRVWKLKERSFQIQTQESNTNLENPNELNRRLAENSLTLLKGSDTDIATFRSTDFCTLTIKRSMRDSEPEEILDRLKEMKSEVEKEKDILILLTPPQVKPANIFGLLQQEIDFVNALIRTKSVVLYLFGNPYVLNHLNIQNAKAVVAVYQNFTEFQDVATEHFLGKLKAKGKLPVSVNMNAN